MILRLLADGLGWSSVRLVRAKFADVVSDLPDRTFEVCRKQLNGPLEIGDFHAVVSAVDLDFAHHLFDIGDVLSHGRANLSDIMVRLLIGIKALFEGFDLLKDRVPFFLDFLLDVRAHLLDRAPDLEGTKYPSDEKTKGVESQRHPLVSPNVMPFGAALT